MYNNSGDIDTSFSSMTRRSPPKDGRKLNGCVELGKDAGRGNVYRTRYRIDHRGQRSELCHELMLEEMVPCCGEKPRRSCWYMIWAIMRSEAFLFTLHMTALVLGAVKEAANFRQEQEDLHLIHSVIETFVSILMVSVRVASCWTAFYHIKKGAKRYEKLPERDENYKKHHVQGHSLKHYLIAFTGLGVFLLLFLISTFLTFYFLAHLGWTIITNQFALVAISVASGLFMARVESAEAIIREDHHKAVLYEATLLLRELHYASTDPNVAQKDRHHAIAQAETFCKALRDTDLFEQPEHIKFDEIYKPAQSLTFNAMMQSFV